MTRALLVAALLVGTSTLAAADPIGIGGYAGLGIGPAGAISNFRDATVTPDGRSAQVFAGIRFKGTPIVSRFSIEASAALNSFVVNNAIAYDARMLGIAGRYSQPLGFGMDVYGKLGIAHTAFEADSDYTLDGSQLLLGVGAEYRIPTTVKLSVLVDYTIYKGELEGTRLGTIDPNERLWKLGFTIGF